ncbi:hypothetical protein VSX60_17865, partial [Aurantimonas sp. A3-2-R12]|nr:hypothetical protein [Aurantimonas sp. A3-2-R12]
SAPKCRKVHCPCIEGRVTFNPASPLNEVQQTSGHPPFDIGGEQYGDRLSVDDVADESRVTLNGLLRSPVVRFTYTYDFGDNLGAHGRIRKKRAGGRGRILPRLHHWKAQLSSGGLRRRLGK